MEENKQGLAPQEGPQGETPFQVTADTDATAATAEAGVSQTQDGSGDNETPEVNHADQNNDESGPDTAVTELSPEAGEDEEVVLETDEDILKRVAEAAHTEAGGEGSGGIDALLAAQYFKNNPEAHPDQYWELLSKRKGTKEGFYEQSKETQEYYEAFAASVKNAYYPAEQE